MSLFATRRSCHRPITSEHARSCLRGDISMKIRLLAIIGAAALATVPTIGQVRDFVPVTDQMLLTPSPNDWLMGSRTYDSQRFSQTLDRKSTRRNSSHELLCPMPG